MDDLDRHLAELNLLNNTELPPNPNIGHVATLGKKVGPAVPPKPKKQQPLVPQSCAINKNIEPLYSSKLNTNHQYYSNYPTHTSTLSNAATLPIGSSLHSNAQYANAQYANVYPDHENQYSNLPRAGLGSLPRNICNTPSAGGSLRGSNQSLTSTASSINPKLVGPRAYTKPEQNVTYSNIQVGPPKQQDGLLYSNLQHHSNNIYSNMPQGNVYANDDLPPPPPPPELTNTIADYAPCTVNINFPPPPDELPPPPSPVSSSYSELRRATQPSQDYNNYGLGSQQQGYDPYGFGMSSQASSTYESIYEPINPRPPSQMSSRSNYSLYAPYVSGGSNMSGPSQSASRIGLPKEQEVDALTNLLVQNMEGHGHGGETDGGDVYGTCVKCGEKVVGENSGCTAMDQIYHTKCFTCHQCAINLQGKPFYSLEGNPYCEEDYLNTLEKCCVCQKPILDRILRATGKPYHPKCFCCVICGKSLDGIPFTVDATNHIHCIEDFHKKFAPRCCVCKQPIMPEPGEEETVRVVALDRSFHIHCYKCEDCGLILSSEAEGRGCYPLDDHVLCKSCNAKRVQALTSHMTTEL